VAIDAAQAKPIMTLVEHAEICAEIALGVDAPGAICAKYSVSQSEKTAADDHYRRLVATDGAANQAWQTAFEARRRQILAQRGAR
jgi:hypothetical protein